MNKILLALLLFSSISYANTITLDPYHPTDTVEHPRFRDILKSKAKELAEKRLAKQMEREAEKQAVKAVAKRVVIRAAVVSAEGAATRSLLKTAYDHKFALGATALVGAGLYGISEQIKDGEYEVMITSTLFASLSKELAVAFDKVNTTYENDSRIKICTKQLAYQYLVSTSPPMFEMNINSLLPKIDNQLVLNVNTYDASIKSYGANKPKLSLLANNQDHEQDHVPSYYAIEEFLGIPHNKLKRNYNLNKNATTVDLLESWHKKGRTFGKKNTKDTRKIFGKKYRITPKYEKDANDLDLATRKDLIIMAYVIAKWGSATNLVDFKKSAIEVYTRNKLLCLYDI